MKEARIYYPFHECIRAYLYGFRIHHDLKTLPLLDNGVNSNVPHARSLAQRARDLGAEKIKDEDLFVKHKGQEMEVGVSVNVLVFDWARGYLKVDTRG